MKLFIATFIIMLLVIAMMAVGYIFQRKKIKGSCGGIADLGLEKVCNCEEPCDKRKEMMRRQELRQREEQQLHLAAKLDAIDIKTIEH